MILKNLKKIGDHLLLDKVSRSAYSSMARYWLISRSLSTAE